MAKHQTSLPMGSIDPSAKGGQIALSEANAPLHTVSPFFHLTENLLALDALVLPRWPHGTGPIPGYQGLVGRGTTAMARVPGSGRGHPSCPLPHRGRCRMGVGCRVLDWTVHGPQLTGSVQGFHPPNGGALTLIWCMAMGLNLSGAVWSHQSGTKRHRVAQKTGMPDQIQSGRRFDTWHTKASTGYPQASSARTGTTCLMVENGAFVALSWCSISWAWCP